MDQPLTHSLIVSVWASHQWVMMKSDGQNRGIASPGRKECALSDADPEKKRELISQQGNEFERCQVGK
jgi:hypothetical protein